MPRHPDTGPRRTDGGPTDYCCKIDRISDHYNLPDLDDELIHRRSEEDASLRDLADYINTQLVAAALADADTDIAANPQEVLHVIRDTTDDTDLDVDRVETIRTALATGDINTDEIDRNTVSYETVRVHLNDHLDVDTSRDTEVSSIPETREKIARLRDRDTSIIERAVYALRRDNQVESGPVDASLSIRVTCTACGRTHTIDAYLDNEGCECRGNPADTRSTTGDTDAGDATDAGEQ